ncbi:hypothetical protein BJV77DRAFT_97929 [Russula vinacea]|nr:hypothetical protein BJV77DRAFT_97929 [Russula vinacea]
MYRVKKLHIGSSLTLELSKALEWPTTGCSCCSCLSRKKLRYHSSRSCNKRAFHVHESSGIRRSSHTPIGSLEVAVGLLFPRRRPWLNSPKSLAAQAGPRPKLEDASRKEKKRWQARGSACMTTARQEPELNGWMSRCPGIFYKDGPCRHRLSGARSVGGPAPIALDRCQNESRRGHFRYWNAYIFVWNIHCPSSSKTSN